MRRITLIFALLLSLMGVRQANAETLTANFDSGLPEGWSLVGDISNSDDRARSGKGLWTSSKSTTDNYVITEAVEGTFEFYARAYNKSYASTVDIYEYTGSGLGTKLYSTPSMYSSSTPTWSKYSFTVEEGTQLAIVLNYAAIDDVKVEDDVLQKADETLNSQDKPSSDAGDVSVDEKPVTSGDDVLDRLDKISKAKVITDEVREPIEKQIANSSVSKVPEIKKDVPKKQDKFDDIEILDNDDQFIDLDVPKRTKESEIVTILVLDDVDSIMGIDEKVYGPFRSQDIVTLPKINANIFVKNRKARFVKI